jgi:hypothetical protein
MPSIQLASTDANSDYIRYKIELATDAGFTQNLQTFNQTLSQTGWSGQNTQGGSAYTSGSTATYTLQANLTTNTWYFIRGYAIDPGGSNQWSNAGTTVTFQTAILYSPSSCDATLLDNAGPIRINWVDSTPVEDNYRVEVAMNGGAFVEFQVLPANTETTDHSSVASLTLYQYRIRASTLDGQYGAYCTTNTVQTFTLGNMMFEKVMMEGLKVR